MFIKRATEDFVGLFGYSEGEIRNIGLENVNMTGTEEVGGLVGENHNIVTNSYTTGIVSGHEDAGGLAGENEPGGIITNSYSSATISKAEATIASVSIASYSEYK